MTLEQLLAQLECVVTEEDREAVRQVYLPVLDSAGFNDPQVQERAEEIVARHRIVAVKAVLRQVFVLLNSGA